MDFGPLVVALIAGGVGRSRHNRQSPLFEVVSIKRGTSGAFPVGPEARLGGPDWMRSDRFSVEARASRDASAEEIRRTVQALLKDRFQLAVRQEHRQSPIYTLVLSRDDKRLWDYELSYTGQRKRTVSGRRPDTIRTMRAPCSRPYRSSSECGWRQDGARWMSWRFESAAQPTEN